MHLGTRITGNKTSTKSYHYLGQFQRKALILLDIPEIPHNSVGQIKDSLQSKIINVVNLAASMELRLVGNGQSFINTVSHKKDSQYFTWILITFGRNFSHRVGNLAIKRWYTYIFPPCTISIPALLCKTGNMEITNSVSSILCLQCLCFHCFDAVGRAAGWAYSL